MNCPRCRVELIPHQASKLLMQCCQECGGVFLDGSASKRVVEAVDPGVLQTAGILSEHAAARPSTEQPIACPICNNALERMPLQQAGVTLDVCREHGVWFDKDELQRVVQAVTPKVQQQQAAQVQAPQPPPQAQQPLPPGMAPGQYVAPGWLEGNAPQTPSFLGGGGAPPGAPTMPGQPQQGQGGEWGLGKTALAVGGGLAAVAGVAYVASHTHIGQQAMGTHQSGFGAVGELFSQLF